jgi:phosphoribosylaminoimidazole carboxylase (NCAIR synthetase)
VGVVASGGMLVTFVAPFFTENTQRFLTAVVQQPGVRVATVGQETLEKLPESLRGSITHHERVADALSADTIVSATRRIAAAHGEVARLLGVIEQVQVPLAAARRTLGLPGMTEEQALNFRDKTRMKDRLREAGVPVARHRLVETAVAAREFAREVGYPLVVKPPAGAASQTTFRVNDEAELTKALGPTSLAAGGVALLEEFVTGEEHSFDAFVEGGRVVFYSLTNYLPTPLVVMQNPWMQWMVVLPRENEQADIAEVGAQTLATLGLEDGMCHLEWFRRADGSLVVSEVAARPPGAQFPTMIARAHEFDAIDAWARIAVGRPLGSLPGRKYAAGAAYLRGQGEGRVRAVHGFEAVRAELGDRITDVRLPTLNQEKSLSYEGEGFVIVRHEETHVVTEALRKIVSTVRVELGG